MAEEQVPLQRSPTPLARACEGLLFWSAMICGMLAVVIATSASETFHHIYAAGFLVAAAIAGASALVIRALAT